MHLTAPFTRSRIPLRRVPIQLAALLLLLASAPACRSESRSAAADVSGEDVRRLPPTRKATVPDIMVQAADAGRVIGGDSSAVPLFVISDYECADCQTWFQATLPVLRAEYIDAGRIRLTWVHYPLREHQNAVAAASASLCAAAQGKFWEASAKIFAARSRWAPLADPTPLLDSIATVPGINTFSFRDCTASKRLVRQIRADINWVDKGAVGTPLTVLVGRRRVPVGASIVALRAAIDSAIAGK